MPRTPQSFSSPPMISRRATPAGGRVREVPGALAWFAFPQGLHPVHFLRGKPEGIFHTE
jgi:hypothetical protein